ncbi:MAG: hypothetical protein L0Y72_17120 [Gemmataceae bacterium]|nr:hypothetical protein [Gemmataceae bacterium]MCI0740774.1 hypothetical protein [Gemmataceae bacterium]
MSFKLKLLTLVAVPAVIIVGVAIAMRFINAPRPVYCPHCQERYRVIGFSSDERQLLWTRSQREMHGRIRAFFERHPEAVKNDSQYLPQRSHLKGEVSKEDEEVVFFFNDCGVPHPSRMALISNTADSLEAKLGMNALLCPNCKKAQLVVHPLTRLP